MRAEELKEGSLSGGFFSINGADVYRVTAAEGFFKKQAGEDSLSLTVIDKLRDIGDALFAFSAMSFTMTPNVVIIRDAEAKLDEASHKKLTTVLKCGHCGNYLVFSNVGFLNAEEKRLVTNVECDRLDRYAAARAIEKSFGGKIERGAAELLCEYVDCDLARAELEREKLEAFCQGRTVTRADVEETVVEDADLQVYEFVNSVATGKKALAFKQLSKLRKRGEPLSYLLAALTGQFRRMLYAAVSPLSDESLAELMKVKPFAVKKARETTFSKLRLKNTVDMLTAYEYKFKSGEMTEQAAFDGAAARLTGEAV